MYFVGNRDFEKEMSDIDCLIKTMEATESYADGAFKISGEIFGIPDKLDENGFQNKYKNPLYTFQNHVHGEKEKGIVNLAENLIRRWQKMIVPNVDVSLSKMLESVKVKDEDDSRKKREMRTTDLEKGFKAGWLMELFKNMYVANAKRLSEEDLLDCARGLLPYRVKEDKGPISEILFQKVIRVRAYGNSSELGESIEAVNKIARVILRDENVISVDNEIAVLDWREFKNGRLDLKFNSEEDARKVAEVLINGFPK